MRTNAARVVKRCLDVCGASAGLFLLSPVLGAAALAVRVSLGRPILFRQTRAGLGGRPFTILKLRTMRSPRPGEVWFRTDEDRLTRLGRLLRTTSVDELPELWNVLRGDMSLVGPRPLFTDYLPAYTEEERRRHDVLPGLTGWAVVHGRNDVPFRRRLQLDVWYVDHWSLWLDLRILATTALQVVRRSGAAAIEDGAGMGFPMQLVQRVDATAGAHPASAGGEGRAP